MQMTEAKPLVFISTVFTDFLAATFYDNNNNNNNNNNFIYTQHRNWKLDEQK